MAKLKKETKVHGLKDTVNNVSTCSSSSGMIIRPETTMYHIMSIRQVQGWLVLLEM